MCPNCSKFSYFWTNKCCERSRDKAHLRPLHNQSVSCFSKTLREDRMRRLPHGTLYMWNFSWVPWMQHAKYALDGPFLSRRVRTCIKLFLCAARCLQSKIQILSCYVRLWSNEIAKSQSKCLFFLRHRHMHTIVFWDEYFRRKEGPFEFCFWFILIASRRILLLVVLLCGRRTFFVELLLLGL